MTDDLELAVIGDFLFDENRVEMVRRYVNENNLMAEHFTNVNAKAAFTAIMSETTEDHVLLQNKVKEVTNGEFVCKTIGKASKVSTDVCMHIKKLVDEAERRRAKEFSNEITARVSSCKSVKECLLAAKLMLTEAEQKYHKGELRDSDDVINFNELGDPTPEEENPDALFGNGWLRKGQANVLVATTGVGKSVIAAQLAYAWALGKEIFGLKPLRPLRIAFLQTEDDLEEMRRFRKDMREGYKTLHGWTDEELNKAERNLTIPKDFSSQTGEKFVEYFKLLQLKHHYDLVIINPLQGVCGCDIANNSELRKFVRDMLDPVIKAEETKCALFIVHHTNKPPTGNERASFGNDRFVEYLGAGGAELTNWIRSMFVIIPVKNYEGVFDLIAAKRGERLNWPKFDGDKATKPHRYIAHSKDISFWREVDPPDGKMKKQDIKLEDAAKQLAEHLKISKMVAGDARKYARDVFGRANGDKVYEIVRKNLTEYGLRIDNTGIHNGKIIVPIK